MPSTAQMPFYELCSSANVTSPVFLSPLFLKCNVCCQANIQNALPIRHEWGQQMMPIVINVFSIRLCRRWQSMLADNEKTL
jgi:hypothetical protein